ncbi:hypothetical protein GCM10022381_13270 [Leifsonia kafniensis]|uniref:ESX-1 secretion-associated protein n=1 Tax=Leifsonia kafniensis TaxID=475957 RepID=A0ABP7KB36_9MICO
MSKWSIDTSAVFGVLSDVRTTSDALGTAFGSVSAAQEELMGGLPGLPGVAEAVAGVLSSEASRFTNVGNRITAGVLGASSAAASYTNADEKMAADAQRAAVAASASGDFSFFNV